ncbi:histone deacetylase [Methanoculleus sp. FWC-SCC3]|uniref:Histone deacetylase n=1 Tax=Methanoculleus methanifontis TaxID=2584086 RepID=A0ABT8M188_9EURY|nr:histone deacetylase [Methanoculleus sp. FWC-SCC3]MDN7012637.1 histone deacetylase [Methanoculleus sp. FWC-SCC3]
MRSSVIYGDVFTRHDMEAHPESGARLRAALSGIPKNVRWRAPVRATETDLARVHDPRYIRWVREMATGTCFLDVNTYVTCHSFDAASYAAGSTFAAVERTLDGEHLFALVRPPGHHAEPDRAMGFCIFNNAAVAAAKALQSVDRVAILDWDLHHGNGTQTAFYGSDRVLYCSVHEENSFPKTGWVDEIGTGRGRGYTLNAPLRAGSTIADYAQVFEEIFVPAIARFRPDVLIISAGQDSLADDEHGRMNLEPEDYGVLAGMLVDGTDLPLALTLEGGYGPSIGEAIRAIFEALAGKRFEPPERPLNRGTERVVDLLKKVRFC